MSIYYEQARHLEAFLQVHRCIFGGVSGAYRIPMLVIIYIVYYPVILKYMFPHTQHICVQTYKSDKHAYKLFAFHIAVNQRITEHKYKSKYLHIIYFL